MRTTCHYPWLATSIVSITDGNYYIDVNIIVYYGAVAAGARITDFNMDTNNSFYIDNTPASCKMDVGRGNNYVWEISNESGSNAAGSENTIYTATSTISSSTPSFASASLGKTVSLSGNFDNGTKKYSCYVTDTAGNTSSTEEKKITYPSAGGTVVTGAGGGVTQSIAAMQSIFSNITADPVEFAKANPILVVIVLIAGYVIWKGQSKKGKKKKGK